jgi:plasmid maintenance system antidote protein VapI
MKTTTHKTTRVVDLRRMRRPQSHPGEMLLEEFLKPLGLTQAEAARCR